MSLEINWAALNPSIAENVKSILNDRFSEAELPGILRNLEVLAFDLGSVPPEITLKDIEYPFPEFYEDESEVELNQNESHEPTNSRGGLEQHSAAHASLSSSPEQRRRSMSVDPGHNERHESHHSRGMTLDDLETSSQTSGPPPYDMHHTHRPTNSASGWEGMNLPFFHSTFATPHTGIVSASGLSTPRLNVVGWASTTFQPSGPTISEGPRRLSAHSLQMSEDTNADSDHTPDRKTQANDIQLKVQVTYTGDIVVRLKVDLALNYPSPFFVTLPIEMTISELHIDTIAAVAYIDQKVHISLLEAPENPIRGFKIKSQIGEQDKVSLTDVEKVEKFVLKAVQDMVEQELVFPSYYTVML